MIRWQLNVEEVESARVEYESNFMTEVNCTAAGLI